MDEGSDRGVTVLARHVVEPEREAAFREWVAGISAASREFDGYMGTEVIRPVTGDEREFVVIFRFGSYPQLEMWMTSSERDEWIARAGDFSKQAAKLEHHSLEFWFAPAKAGVPSRHKMAVVTFAVIWPLVHFLPALVARSIGPRPLLVEVISVGAIVLLMTYALMPVISRVLAPWLAPA